MAEWVGMYFDVRDHGFGSIGRQRDFLKVFQGGARSMGEPILNTENQNLVATLVVIKEQSSIPQHVKGLVL